MNILVCVKQVPDTTEIKMDSRTNTLDRSSAATILSMGPPQAREVIRKCIEMGADDGVLLTDKAFAGYRIPPGHSTVDIC